MPPAGLSWMSVLELGGILSLLAPMRWLPRLPVGSQMNGLHLTSSLLLSLVSAGALLRFLALVPLSLFGLPSGWTLLDRSSSSSSKDCVQDIRDI